jgi:glyoxylase-like metal-dependent hydrolase (beta-lactamase superfamily II)
MTLLSGKDAIDLFYFGPAHTDGDAFVVFRDLRTMHAGDVFAGKSLPFIDVSNGGSGLTFGETIGKAAAGIKDVDIVIPGHGALVKWQDFVDFVDFDRLYLDHARSALKAGRTAEQAMADLKLPEKFKDYNLQGGRDSNFKVIFEELQKK